MMKMKKILLTAMLAAALGTITIGNSAMAMVNPMTESTKENLVIKTSIEVNVPEKAEDVAYFVIDTGDEKIAQMDFKLDGKEYCFRGQMTKEVKAFDNSGMNYEWTTEEKIPVEYCDGHYLACDHACVIYWIDIVPGINYSLSCKEKVDSKDMAKVAEECCVSAQEGVEKLEAALK